MELISMYMFIFASSICRPIDSNCVATPDGLHQLNDDETVSDWETNPLRRNFVFRTFEWVNLLIKMKVFMVV